MRVRENEFAKWESPKKIQLWGENEREAATVQTVSSRSVLCQSNMTISIFFLIRIVHNTLESSNKHGKKGKLTSFF